MLYGEVTTNENLAGKFNLKQLGVSNCNPFLEDLGIIRSISKKKIVTEIGTELGFALDDYPEDVPKIWRKIINGKPKLFFYRLFKVIREEKKETQKDIQRAIYKAAEVGPNVRTNSDFNTGSKAIIDILRNANYLKFNPPNHYFLNEEFVEEIEINISSINEIEKESLIKKYPYTVFIIHGHDNEMKNTVARFLEGIGVDAVILHERPDKSRTIIQKVLDYANDIGYAIALLSPDDMGYSKERGAGSELPRARQNVILELGIFLGKHGKDKVILLVREREKIEFPSDYDGVLVKDYHSNSDNWKNDLIKELKNWKFNVDANKMYQIKG